MTVSTDEMRSAVVPPDSVRRRFWLLGRRVPPQWRPWVAEQVTRPGYLLRRQLVVFAIQLVLVVIPQLLLSFADERPWRRIFFPAVFTVAFGFGVLATRRKTEMQVARLLAYHGVTADGRLREPVSAWRLMGYTSPIFTPVVSALLVAQFVLVVSGAALVVNHYTSPGRCQTAPSSVVADLEAELGQTQVPGSAVVTTPLFTEGELRFPRRVDSGLGGLYYVAAYVDGAPPSLGRDVAVWRVIEPGGALPVPSRDISAANEAARAVTPVTGYSSNDPPDRRIERARRCVLEAAARD